MKRIDRLLDAIGMADDAYIEAASPQNKPAAPRRIWTRWAATAACIMLISALGLTVLPRLAGVVGSDGAAAECAPNEEQTPARVPEVEDSGDTDDGRHRFQIGTDDNPLADQYGNADIYPPDDGPITPDSGESADDLWQDTREYRDVDVQTAEIGIVWSWDDLTPAERYTSFTFGTGTYRTCAREIDEEYIGAHRGNTFAVGYENHDASQERLAECAVYDIRGIGGDRFAAIRIVGDDRYYLFMRDEYDPPATFGEAIALYSMDTYLPLTRFYIVDDDGEEVGTHSLKNADSTALWELLSDAADAPFAEHRFHEGAAAMFTVTSPAYGIENRSFAVYADGYVQTNAFDYGYAYFIGEEAACAVIEYAVTRARPAKEERVPTLVGTVTDIMPASDGGYTVRVDDSIMMKAASDGIVFSVDMSAPKLSRWLKHNLISVGDTVVITYDGVVDEETYAIDGARTVEPAILTVDGDILIPE